MIKFRQWQQQQKGRVPCCLASARGRPHTSQQTQGWNLLWYFYLDLLVFLNRHVGFTAEYIFSFQFKRQHSICDIYFRIKLFYLHECSKSTVFTPSAFNLAKIYQLLKCILHNKLPIFSFNHVTAIITEYYDKCMFEQVDRKVNKII